MARYSSGVTGSPHHFHRLVSLTVYAPQAVVWVAILVCRINGSGKQRERMATLQLSLIMGANDRSRPVLDGAVQPDGIELTCTIAHPSEIFWRQLHFQEF